MKSIFNIPPPGTPEHEEMKPILVWWYNGFVPQIVGPTRWGDTQRNYHLTIDMMGVWGKPDKKDHVRAPRVTVQDEAFAMMALANNHVKWGHCFKYKEDNPTETKVPEHDKNNPSTKKYHEGLWSFQFAGKGKGWKDEAYKVNHRNSQWIREERNKDKEVNWKHQKLILKLLREANKIGENTATKKGKRKRHEEPVTIVDLDALVDDEVDDYDKEDEEENSYSVHSEGNNNNTNDSNEESH